MDQKGDNATTAGRSTPTSVLAGAAPELKDADIRTGRVSLIPRFFIPETI